MSPDDPSHNSKFGFWSEHHCIYFLTIVLSTVVAVRMKFDLTCRQRNLSSMTALRSVHFSVSSVCCFLEFQPFIPSWPCATNIKNLFISKQIFIILFSTSQWACLQRSESHSESRFGSWFWPFPDLKAWFYPLWMQSSFNQAYEMRKNGVLDRDLPRIPDSEDLWTQSSFGTWFMCVHFGNARWSHESISAVGTKYYLAVRRSCSWSGRQLQCLWTHVVQITNPIRKRIVIRNGFRNAIRSFVNMPSIKHSFLQQVEGSTSQSSMPDVLSCSVTKFLLTFSFIRPSHFMFVLSLCCLMQLLPYCISTL